MKTVWHSVNYVDRAQAAEDVRVSVGAYIDIKGNREWTQTDNLTWKEARDLVASMFRNNWLPYLYVKGQWYTVWDYLPEKPN